MPVMKVGMVSDGWVKDADRLDDQEGSYYLDRANHTGTQPPSSISPQGSGSGLDADKVDGFHASLTPGPNVIPVSDNTGKISPRWIDVYRLVPYWKVSIDETSNSRSTPTNFTVSRVVKYMSYGAIYWYIPSWGGWSTLWGMKVKSPTAITVGGKLVAVDDNAYIYLNNNLVASATGAGFKNVSFKLNLVPGENLIQIVHNNSGGTTVYLVLEIDFDWRILEFIPS